MNRKEINKRIKSMRQKDFVEFETKDWSFSVHLSDRLYIGFTSKLVRDNDWRKDWGRSLIFQIPHTLDLSYVMDRFNECLEYEIEKNEKLINALRKLDLECVDMNLKIDRNFNDEDKEDKETKE